MSNELLEAWKKRGIGPAQPKVEQKKNPPQFVPMGFKGEDTKISSSNPPAPAPTKHRAANDEMREIMKKKEEVQANIEAQKSAPKPTYLNPTQDTKKEVPSQPKEFSNPKQGVTQVKEIQPKEIQQKKIEVKKEEKKKMTANDEMREIFKNRANPVKIKEEPKKKTANEEALEIMKMKEKTEPKVEPMKEKKPTDLEEMKKTISSAGTVQTKVKPSKPIKEIKNIDQDEQMKRIKELLESQIRFTAGDNLELKPKIITEDIEEQHEEPIIEQQAEVIQEEQQEARKEESEDSDEPKDNPEAAQKPAGLFADD